jgi:beta-galactosidase
VTRKYAAFIRREGENLLTSRTRSRICAGLYTPYFHTELTTSQMLREKRLHIEALGLTHDPKFVREELFFNGLLRGFQTLNFNYDVRDLELTDAETLTKYRQLWVVTTDFMDSGTQERLVSFVKLGGHLVIYPAIPLLDEYLNPCTVLCDGLGVRVRMSPGPNKVDAFGIEDVYSHTKDKQVFEDSGGEVVAVTKLGETCGIRKSVGNGKVTALGFAFGYTTDENLLLIEKILALDRIRRELKVSDPEIQFVVRRGKKHSYIFLLNYHNRKKIFTVGSKRHSMDPFSCKTILL